MILLIWSSERAAECAKSIQQTFQQPVCIVSSLQRGCEQLQSHSFFAVVLDQGIAEAEPGQRDFLFQHLAGAVPVLVNFGISGLDRILSEVRAALNRRMRENILARREVTLAFRNELKDDLTALLLSCGIALGEPTLSETASQRVRRIEEVANRMREKLMATEEAESKMATSA
jgi:hypothetical protein